MPLASIAHVRVSLLTPPGRGALAVVGVAGPGAVDIVAQLFAPRGGQPLCDRPDGAIAFGRWGDADHGEELVVVRLAADRLEVHCHGGLAASEAVIASLEAGGAIRQPWGQWLRDGGMNEIETEARDALARAGGPKAARILCRQLAGALQHEFDQIQSLRRAGDAAAAEQAVARLRRAARVGLRLTRPWRVVVVGPVNAGKSSLVNALAGHRRSIVSAEPGTTRDVVTTRVVLDGWEIDLVDTAGLRQPGDTASPTEQAGIERALAAAKAADLVLDVQATTDSGPLPSHEDGQKSGLGDSPPRLRVITQCDLAEAEPLGGNTLRTSAVTGDGIDELASAICWTLMPDQRDDSSMISGPVPFTERQAALLGWLETNHFS